MSLSIPETIGSMRVPCYVLVLLLVRLSHVPFILKYADTGGRWEDPHSPGRASSVQRRHGRLWAPKTVTGTDPKNGSFAGISGQYFQISLSSTARCGIRGCARSALRVGRGQFRDEPFRLSEFCGYVFQFSFILPLYCCLIPLASSSFAREMRSTSDDEVQVDVSIWRTARLGSRDELSDSSNDL